MYVTTLMRVQEKFLAYCLNSVNKFECFIYRIHREIASRNWSESRIRCCCGCIRFESECQRSWSSSSVRRNSPTKVKVIYYTLSISYIHISDDKIIVYTIIFLQGRFSHYIAHALQRRSRKIGQNYGQIARPRRSSTYQITHFEQLLYVKSSY